LRWRSKREACHAEARRAKAGDHLALSAEHRLSHEQRGPPPCHLSRICFDARLGWHYCSSVGSRAVALIGLFLLLAVPRDVAAAEAPGTIDARIDTVRVAEQPDGTIVAVKLRGRPRPRLLRSVERLVAIVIADVDADGDLDILASTIRQGLLMWRNVGRGHFVLARIPKARDALARVPRLSPDRRASAHDEPGEGGVDGAIPRTDTAGDPLVLRALVLSKPVSPAPQYRLARTGRAPPPLA
jgi:hypothetical protein